MRFFRSSKLSQPPLPNLSIHLDTSSDKVFRPDELVTGQMILTPIVPITPHAIEVSLYGQSLVWHRTGHGGGGQTAAKYYHWRDNAPLFEVCTNVLSTSHTTTSRFEPNQAYNFPFSFRFPVSTGNSRLGQYKKNGDERWAIGPHFLPPSFFHTNNAASNIDTNYANYAKIEYGIKAMLVCPGVGVVKGKRMQNLTATSPVLFLPLPRSLSPDVLYPGRSELLSRIFTLRSSALTTEDGSSKSFGKGLRHPFSPALPKLTFQTRLMVPNLLNLGTEFLFSVYFNVISKSSDVSHIPAVLIMILKLSLMDLTCVRAPRDRAASKREYDGCHRKDAHTFMPPSYAPYSGRERQVCSKHKTKLTDNAPQSVVLESVNTYNGESDRRQPGNEVQFKCRLPATLPPSFKSFAISRRYRLKVKLGVTIGGKTFKHEVWSDIRHICSSPTYNPDVASWRQVSPSKWWMNV
jgi:hypothetical protein